MTTDRDEADSVTVRPNVPNANLDAFKERMRQLVAAFGSVAEVARKGGFSDSTVKKWVDGISDPSRSRCLQLAAGTGVSLYWLLAGVGPMWAKDLQPNERDTLLIVLGDPESDEVRAANGRRDEAIRTWSAGFAAARASEPAVPAPGGAMDREMDLLTDAVRLTEDVLHKFGIRQRANAAQFAELVRFMYGELAAGAAEDAASAALERILDIARTPR